MMENNFNYENEGYDFVIVGAGIAGLTAAYFLAKLRNKKVLLLDSDEAAGGLLKSDDINGAFFDYGTHHMSETGLEELDDFLFSACTKENYKITRLIEVGSYFNGTLSEKNCTVDLSSLEENIRNKCYFELLQSNGKEEYDSLKDFFVSRYGDTVYENVFYPVSKKYFGAEPDELHYSAGYFFDMSHVLAFNKEIWSELKKIDRYNKVLSHHVRVDGIIKHYPKHGGLSTFINMLMKKVKEAGVEVRLNAKLTGINVNDNLVESITVNDKEIKVKKIVWTLASGLFVFLSGIKQIKTSRPEFRGTTLFDFAFNKPLKTKCNFINIYQPDMLSGRITIYKNMGAVYNDDTYTCTVEVLFDEKLDESYIKPIQEELNNIGLIDESYECKYSGVRTIKTGFPVLYNNFVKVNAEATMALKERVSNVILSGKGVGKVFFMGDVLRDMYLQIKEEG